jgi:5-formyltetrahydrofolate cyclo-ligase
METEKQVIRRELHAVLRGTSAEEREVWSSAVRDSLLAAAAWKSARTVMLFAALRYEPDLVPLLDLNTGKRLVFPVLEEDFIITREVKSPGDLAVSGHGIREPERDHCPVVAAEEIDLVMVPGLGFGSDGSRLGRGKGHYDRLLAKLPDTTLLCGVCFGCQLSGSMPLEGHDIPMHALLTENGWQDLSSPLRHPSAP